MLLEEKAAGRRGAALLLHLKEERIDDSISAILILNTMANTLGATMAGAQAARVFGSSVIGVFSGVLTLLILVVSEIIPKTLGALHSRRLAGPVGHTLDALTWVMTPALGVSRLLTRLLAPRQPSRLSKGELAAVIAAAARAGALNITQTKLFESLLRFDEIKVADVMTPRPMVVMMREEATVAELLGRADADAFSRIPLYAADRIDNVVGYVLQREVLKAVAAGGRPRSPSLALPPSGDVRARDAARERDPQPAARAARGDRGRGRRARRRGRRRHARGSHRDAAGSRDRRRVGPRRRPAASRARAPRPAARAAAAPARGARPLPEGQA